MVQAVLAAPMGGARLMDLLGSDHEVLRNEALLLLVGLTRASAEVQKIAAFEGAFERVLSIARCVVRWPHRLRDALSDAPTQTLSRTGRRAVRRAA